MQSSRGSSLFLAVPEPRRQGAGLSCWAPVGTWGSHRDPGLFPAPSLPAPQGAAVPTLMPQAGVLEMSCPGWGMPQVTGGPLLQPQRGLWKWLFVGPEPASCPQPCRLPARQSWGSWGGPCRGRGCAARPLSTAPVPPPAARCPFNREP